MSNVVAFYNSYAEDSRLKIRRSRILEKLITLKYISKYISPLSRIADIGAGTGIYALEIANKVNSIDAVDLVQKHVDEIDKKALSLGINNIKTICASATDLHMLKNDNYDMVLCLGPMYHLKNKKDRIRCLEECKRILKKDGILFVAYINKLLAMNYYAKNKKFLNEELFFEIEKGSVEKQKGFDEFLDISFFSDPEEVENEATSCDFEVINNLATDGISYFIQEQIEDMTNEQWDIYVKMHERHCEDSNSFGMSMHGLMICKKE